MLLKLRSDLATGPISGLADFGHDRFMDRPGSPEVDAHWEEFRRTRGVPQQEYDACRRQGLAARHLAHAHGRGEAVPVVVWLAKPGRIPKLPQPLSVVVALAGAFWLVERLFFA